MGETGGNLRPIPLSDQSLTPLSEVSGASRGRLWTGRRHPRSETDPSCCPRTIPCRKGRQGVTRNGVPAERDAVGLCIEPPPASGWNGRRTALGFPPINAVYPLFRFDGVRFGRTAGNADRAVLIDFRRFPAGILATSNPLVRHQIRGQDHPLAGRAREDRVRAPDARDRRGDHGLGGGAEARSRGRRRAGSARAAGSVEMREPHAGEHLVEDRRAAGGDGAQARERLALAEAEVRGRLVAERRVEPAGVVEAFDEELPRGTRIPVRRTSVRTVPIPERDSGPRPWRTSRIRGWYPSLLNCRSPSGLSPMRASTPRHPAQLGSRTGRTSA